MYILHAVLLKRSVFGWQHEVNVSALWASSISVSPSLILAALLLSYAKLVTRTALMTHCSGLSYTATTGRVLATLVVSQVDSSYSTHSVLILSTAALNLLWRLTVRRIATRPQHHSLSCRPQLGTLRSAHSFASRSLSPRTH